MGPSLWRASAFTTYSLSLWFFETVILDQLVRANATPVTQAIANFSVSPTTWRVLSIFADLVSVIAARLAA